MAPRLPVDLENNKELFKSFMSTETDFTDYDFEGSNLSQLTDILMLNTQHIAFYLNMTVSELFVDSAKIDQNILKLAYMLNYIPRRNVAPYVEAGFKRINGGTILSKYTKFLIGSIPVVNLEDIVINTGTIDEIHTANLYAGEIITEVFPANSDDFQEFVLSNQNKIDDTYFKVYVDKLQINGTYESVEFFNANASDFDANRRNYYFKYLDRVSVRFDDGELFEKPDLGDNIRIVYLKTEGALYNGQSGTITYNGGNSEIESTFTIEPNTNALANGLDRESDEAIKIRAPLYFTTQGRAVTEPDYNIIIKRYSGYDNFKGGIAWNGADEFIDVNGELSLTSQLRDLGHVELSFLDGSYQQITQETKDSINSYLSKTKAQMIFPRFIPASRLQIDVNTEIALVSEINTIIYELEDTINAYLKTLEGFNSVYKETNVIQYIDYQDEVDYIKYSATFKFIISYEGPAFFRCFNKITANSINYTIDNYDIQDDGAGILQYRVDSGIWQTLGTVNYDDGIFDITVDLPDIYGDLDINIGLADTTKINTKRECFLYFSDIVNTILREE